MPKTIADVMISLASGEKKKKKKKKDAKGFIPVMAMLANA